MDHIMIDVGNVDWELLRKQKVTLFLAIQEEQTKDGKENLTGILHLLDHIQDSAAEVLGEDKVFQTT